MMLLYNGGDSYSIVQTKHGHSMDQGKQFLFHDSLKSSKKKKSEQPQFLESENNSCSPCGPWNTTISFELLNMNNPVYKTMKIII